MSNKEDHWRFTPHQSYGVLGWIETFIKIIAIATGFASLALYGAAPSEYLTARLVIIVAFGLLQLVYVAIIVCRILDGELFAIAFSIVQTLAHLAIFVVSIKSEEPDEVIFVYAFLGILGEFVKILFLFLKKKEEFSVKYLPRSVLWAISIVIAVLYIIILICQVYLFYYGYTGNSGQ
eukprot:TRINITY_DN712_c0_g2_i1.p1 TRINITY_DN712_c0_g2~~TRINITY_DN712_c0_g2_i1.p1  ORF type:complete len:178 (-),score=25.26 TRINITY_DN712_c0_g2_i1:11-544(-)